MILTDREIQVFLANRQISIKPKPDAVRLSNLKNVFRRRIENLKQLELDPADYGMQTEQDAIDRCKKVGIKHTPKGK